MTKYFGVAIDDIFNSMAERFRPEGAADVDVKVGYDIREFGKRKLVISNRKMSLEKTDDLSDCNAVIKTDERTFVGVTVGKIETMEAIIALKFRVKGDQGVLALLPRLFLKLSTQEKDVKQEQELLVLKKVISVKQKFATGPVMGKFLKGLKEEKVLAIKCPECGRLQSPPREVCAICRVKNTEWVEVGPEGELRMLEYCYYASPDPLTGETRETPYGAIGVLLDKCKDEEVFWHLLNPAHLDRVKMGIVLGEKVIKGTRLRPVWSENRTGSINDIKYFEIAE
ncbi:MAG: hypothetical protein KJ737_02600 [Proteobacteria bacterium]|nr:hypothetical protein [Pseudomonadota bacterium]